ncbi:MAG TPA: SRPBCC family protein [Gemmatimonadaceae bacterium]
MHVLLNDTIDIDAPPEVVWSVWSDVERWPEWTASIAQIDLLEPGPLRAGIRARVRQPKLPTAVWTVTSIAPPKGFVWVSKSPGARVTGFHHIEPHGRGSRVELGVRFEGPIAWLVGWLTRGLSQRYLRLEATGLKARSETLAISNE